MFKKNPMLYFYSYQANGEYAITVILNNDHTWTLVFCVWIFDAYILENCNIAFSDSLCNER